MSRVASPGQIVALPVASAVGGEVSAAACPVPQKRGPVAANVMSVPGGPEVKVMC